MGCKIDISRYTKGGGHPDELYTTRDKNATFYAFRFGDKFFETNNFYDIEINTDEEIADGGFVKITADVDFLDGGIAGYLHMPQIRKLKKIEKVSVDDFSFPSVREKAFGIMKIGDYSDGDYFFTARGHAGVYKDGKWLYKYSYNKILSRDDCRIFYREGVAEESIDQGIKNDILCCADYFVLPK